MKIKHFFVMALLVPLSVLSGDFTIMGGVAQFNSPHDGIYWNKNQPHDHQMTPLVFALRYDVKGLIEGYSFGVQYTNFGEVKTDSVAVTKDAPEAGGYDPATGSCVGACAVTARWKMKSETQSVAFIGTKHFGQWSLEGGLNVFEVKTRGAVEYQDGSTFNYTPTRYLGVGPMAGVGYRSGNWITKLQLWRMEGRAVSGEGKSAPAAYKEDYQVTVMVGYQF